MQRPSPTFPSLSLLFMADTHETREETNNTFGLQLSTGSVKHMQSEPNSLLVSPERAQTTLTHTVRS